MNVSVAVLCWHFACSSPDPHLLLPSPVQGEGALDHFKAWLIWQSTWVIWTSVSETPVTIMSMSCLVAPVPRGLNNTNYIKVTCLICLTLPSYDAGIHLTLGLIVIDHHHDSNCIIIQYINITLKNLSNLNITTRWKHSLQRLLGLLHAAIRSQTQYGLVMF